MRGGLRLPTPGPTTHHSPDAAARAPGLLGPDAGPLIWSAARQAVTGEQPGESNLVLPPRSVHLAYALVLLLLTLSLLTGAVLLWRRASWGYVLAPALLVYLVLYQVNYMVALVLQVRADVPHAKPFDPAEPFITGRCSRSVVAQSFCVAAVATSWGFSVLWVVFLVGGALGV
ncbi:hypothetical protein ACFZC6_27655 [Streptomyces ossamyceticus]|uniref:Uncharacterized protein n=1 Tax=Streptomyces ossamyceticus TaxID=249581 RepID=A0ABV2VBW3_9ACTN